MSLTRGDCEALDAADPLAFARERFVLPEGLIYLDGNSLGAMPRSTPGRMADAVEREWGRDLIGSWNSAGWIDMPARVGARIARLIGTEPDEVIAADSTSINLFKLAAGAAKLMAPRRVILSEPGNFPTDLYVLQGLQDISEGAIELRVVPRDQLAEALNEDVALLMLTHVHYKTGAVWDMGAVTRRAHEAGAPVLWDLSHSAGALDLDLSRDGVDLAVGCGYKYLNGGPGAPGFLYVNRKLHHAIRSPLTGWMGHAEPFSFVDEYQPGLGMLRQLCGTPPILGLSALEEGLKTFDGVSMADLRAKSMRLGDLFLQRVQERCGEHGFEIACPRDASVRGSQVSLRHPDGYAIVQALIARGVVGDFRSPDVLRFGFAPLYVSHAEVFDAVERLAEVMEAGVWREERFGRKAAVT